MVLFFVTVVDVVVSVQVIVNMVFNVHRNHKVY